MLLSLLLMATTAQQTGPDVRVLGPGKPNGQTPATLVVEPAAMLIVGCDADGDGATARKELDDCVQRTFVKAAGSAEATLGYIAYGQWQTTWLGDQGALPSPFEVDRNGDDRISLDELQAQFAKLFARFDRNHDGAVTRAEALTVRATAADGHDGRRPGERPRGERVPGAERVPEGRPEGRVPSDPPGG